MFKKISKLFLILFLIVIGVNNVVAIEVQYSPIQDNNINTNATNMENCEIYYGRGYGYYACHVNETDMGYRFTIVNQNGTAVTNSIDLFATESVEQKFSAYRDIVGNSFFEHYILPTFSNLAIIDINKNVALVGMTSLGEQTVNYKKNNTLTSIRTSFLRTNLGSAQVLKGTTLSGYSTMEKKLEEKNSVLFEQVILKKLGLNKETFTNNGYSLLVEPLYVISYTKLDKGITITKKIETDPTNIPSKNINESRFFYGTASEVSKHLYDQVNSNAFYIKNTNYLMGLLVDFIPNLAYNIYISGSVSTSAITSVSSKNGIDYHYNKVKTNLKNIYSTYGYGMGIFNDSLWLNKGNLKIRKFDENNKEITSDNAVFKIYSGSGCLAANELKQQSVKGSITIVLSAGSSGTKTYSLREIESPSGYTRDSGCKNFTIKNNQTTTVSVKNTKLPTTCQEKFSNIKDKTNMYERVKLLSEFPKNTNLLNLNITNPDTACSKATCTLNSSVGCINYSYGSNGFSKSNLSCYKERIDITNSSKNGATHTVFCGVDYLLKNTINLTSNNLGTFKPGMMILNLTKTQPVAKLIATEKCYAVGADTTLITKDFQNAYKSGAIILDTNPNVSLDNEALPSISSSGNPIFTKSSNTVVERKHTVEIDYFLNPVYALKGTGEICDTSSISKDCRLLGYGFVSKLSDTYTSPIYFKVETEFHTTGPAVGTCLYNSTNELPIANLEFRTISKSNPFAGKTGGGRDVGSNWCDSSGNCSYDPTNPISNNTIYKEIITANDSYNSTNEGPLYEFELNADDIKTIRKKYSDKSYEDFYLKCDANATNCKSLLLEEFNIIRLR